VTKWRDTRACLGVARPTVRFASLVGSLLYRSDCRSPRTHNRRERT
jgi:hypothetical protein